jgi:murein DD-endopeptidase MepM/ murein hydrolase activator NlpD
VWQSADPILGKYLPNAGRSDPSKLAGMGGVYNSFNLNLYKYASQNPLKIIDPDGRLELPVDPKANPVTSPMGARVDPLDPAGGVVQGHKGVDQRAPVGTPVVAVAGGTVAFSGEIKGYGNVVIVSHGQNDSGKHRASLTAHLKEPGAKQGTVVREGQQIGVSGNTGRSTAPHVHTEIIVSDNAPAATNEFLASPRLDPQTTNLGNMQWGPDGGMVPVVPRLQQPPTVDYLCGGSCGL